MDLEKKVTLVLVASEKPDRYSYKAVNMLVENNVPVVAVSRRPGNIGDTIFVQGKPVVKGIHTVTLYLNALNQVSFYDYILEIAPQRVLFNPGTENSELQLLLNKSGISWEEACTLVLLRTNQY
jgi:predicted CoA-binding protein